MPQEKMAYIIAGTQLDIMHSPASSPEPPSSHGAPSWAEPPRSPEPPCTPEPDGNATDIVIGRLRPVFNWDYSQPGLGDASLRYIPLSPPASHHWVPMRQEAAETPGTYIVIYFALIILL